MTRRLWPAAMAALLVASACGAPATGTSAPGSPASPSAATPSPTSAPTAPPTPASSASSAASPSPSPAPSASASTAFAHVYLVVMENREYPDIVGAADAPYLNELIARYGLLTDSHAQTHPSQPNYMELVSGSTQGVRDDSVYNVDAPSLFDQVEASGRTWRVYAQGYPGSCSSTAFGWPVADGPGKPGPYARKHNPAISFTSISRNPSRCARITGLSGFDPAAADLEMIVPNEVNDMHSAPVATGDAFLRAFLPSILDSAAFAAGSLLIVTWDEGTTNAGGGGHIATIVATPGMAPGTRIGGTLNHDSVLRTIEDAWGMPPLGGAARASAIPLGY